MLDFVLNFLFPPVCGICGKLNKEWICPKCKKRLEKYECFKRIFRKEEIYNLFNFENKILRCENEEKKSGDFGENKKLINTEITNKNNIECKTEKIYFDEFLYCFEYKNLIRKLLLNYKFNDCSYLAYFFANIIINNKKINEIFKIYDIIIPVPMDRIKKSTRGYNQTELITKIIEKLINNSENNFNRNKLNCNTENIIKVNLQNNCIDNIYPENIIRRNSRNNCIDNNYQKNIIKKRILINNECLIKIKKTKTQSTLSADERKKNIKDAFVLKNIDLKNKNVILFDDICTTSSTVNEISRILRNAGASKILVLVIAKD